MSKPIKASALAFLIEDNCVQIAGALALLSSPNAPSTYLRTSVRYNLIQLHIMMAEMTDLCEKIADSEDAVRDLALRVFKLTKQAANLGISINSKYTCI